MKNKYSSIAILFTLFNFAVHAFAQQPTSDEVASVKMNSNTVEFSISSDHPFYFADNLYILHIGDIEFKLSKQTENDGKGMITFLIPADDFNRLADGTDIYLTYGELIIDPKDDNAMTAACVQAPGRCWNLGKFSKQLLQK